jgi:hypothetical protein
LEKAGNLHPFIGKLKIALVLLNLIAICAIAAPPQAQAQHRLAQRNEFYVPKPSTVPPASTEAPASVLNSRPAPTQEPKILHTRLSGFNIPFKVDANDEAFVEVHLYTSANQGATWSFYNRQPTDATEFPFQSNGEGEYWFAIKTLDRNRRLLPQGDPQPELRIIVDTTEPKLEMTAAADPAGRIVCRWNASDIYLKPKSLQLLYKPTFSGTDPVADTTQWQSVSVNTPTYAPGGIYVDQLAFWPETTVRALDVRIAIADEAGNVVSADRRLAVQSPTWRHSNRATARPTDRPTVDPATVPNSVSSAPVRNMKCADGACEIPPVTANDPQWKRAFYSNLRPPAPENYRPNETASDRKPVPKAIFRENPYSKSAAATSPPAAATASQNRQPRSTADRRTAMLVGSEPEYAAPPTPAGWTLNDHGQNDRPVQTQPARSFRNFQQPPSQIFSQQPQPHQTTYAQPPVPSANPGDNDPNADVWQSNVQTNARAPQTSVGSTLAPDHRMLPIASGGVTPRRTDSIRANPNEIENTGDKWVSKSSTNFPSNQYQGLDNRGLPSNVNSELVPRQRSQTAPRTFESIGNQRPVGQMLNTGYQPRVQQRSAPADFPPSPTPSNIGRASINGPSKTNTQIISTKRFRLNYDINAIDPSGVGKVDLYITQDKGRSWKLWGQDPDNRSPFPVEVQQQGLYGFRVVVHSKDGLVGTGPSSGDDADMWVRIDSQTPMAQITSVPYGRGNEAGRLAINYRVADDFLTLRPVRLSYSRSPQGPWTIIQDNLRNEGRYLWKVDRAVPDRIFLKIDAMDQAGNVGTHQLSQSVDVSGLVPRGTIHGVEPVGR